MSDLEILVLLAKLDARYYLRADDLHSDPGDDRKRQLMQWAYDDWLACAKSLVEGYA